MLLRRLPVITLAAVPTVSAACGEPDAIRSIPGMSIHDGGSQGVQAGTAIRHCVYKLAGLG